MKWIVRIVLLALWAASIIYVFGIGALVGKFAPQVAEESMNRSAPLLMMFLADYEPCQGVGALECGFQDTTGRTEVSCQAYMGERSAVLMTFGQSNSANAGDDKYIPLGPVANFNIHDGKCYEAEDPLLGPDAEGGAVWGVLADKLIAQGHYDNVMIVPFGIGGSAISQWQADGRFHDILRLALDRTATSNIAPTHVLWHQGESDAGAGTSERDYFNMFDALVGHIRSGGVTAPVYPAVATHCALAIGGESEPAPGAEAVRTAQARLVELPGVFAGPDTDQIQGPLYRHDNCHFNAKGMQAHADAWLSALTD